MKTIVVVGGGAGGLELVVGLSKNKQANVILVDRERTHIWKPHLHEVAAGTLDSSYEQVDYLNLAVKFGFSFVWGELEELNKEEKEITLKNKVSDSGEEILPVRKLNYDILVIGVGSTSNDFNTPGVKEFAFSLDDLNAANMFHKTMLEKVIKHESDINKSDDFSLTIIGGGATGVELAAEMTETVHKLSQFGLKKLQKNPIKITVINAADVLLPGLSERISLGAKEILEDAKVIVLNSTKVIGLEKNKTKIIHNGVESILYSDLIVWAAGVKSPDFLKNLGLETNRGNQIVVNGNLQSTDVNIFAIGDCASVKWINSPKEGLSVPPRAQSAHQMSDYLIKNILKIHSGKNINDFIYRDFGSLISLGSGETVGTLMGFLKGRKLFIEGKFAKFMYLNLYHHHQVQINGFIPAMGLLLGKSIQKRFKAKVKLH